MENIPIWLADLEDEDAAFIKKFVLASGSLKEVAALYGVSYPTVRLRLDRLIQKIKISETAEADPYVSLVKRLAVDDKLDFDTAKILIGEYRKTKGERKCTCREFRLASIRVFIFRSTWLIFPGSSLALRESSRFKSLFPDESGGGRG